MAELENFSTNKYEMPIFVGIFVFISRENFMLSWAEHEKSLNNMFHCSEKIRLINNFFECTYQITIKSDPVQHCYHLVGEEVVFSFFLFLMCGWYSVKSSLLVPWCHWWPMEYDCDYSWLSSTLVFRGPLCITKTRLFKYIENFTAKNWKFSDKKFWYFSYFCSIDCGYWLEPPRRSGSNEYPQIYVFEQK